MKTRHTRSLCFLLLLLLAAFTPAMADSYSVAPMNVGNVFVSPDADGVDVTVKLINYGDADVTNVGYTLYYMDTQESTDLETVTLDTPIAPWETGEITVRLKPGKEMGESDVILNIQMVNGNYNEATIGYTYISRYTVHNMPTKRIVVEDYTGLWCQYCPRGTAIMESFQRLHPDEFVGIAIHCGDKLATMAYSSDLESKWALNKPTLWCNRREKINSCNGTTNYEYEKAITTLMGINVSAAFDDSGDNIRVTSEVTACGNPSDGATFAVGYVLTADGLQDASWGQSNSLTEWYSSSYDDAPEELNVFKNGQATVYGLTYNHVAIAAAGIENGIEGSLPGTMSVGETVSHSTTFENISQHTLIQDRQKLSVCALLFNTTTGAIENAAKCAVTSGTSGISSAGTDSRQTPVGYYSADGRRLNGPTKGLNIVRRADGSTVKVVRR